MLMGQSFNAGTIDSDDNVTFNKRGCKKGKHFIYKKLSRFFIVFMHQCECVWEGYRMCLWGESYSTEYLQHEGIIRSGARQEL